MCENSLMELALENNKLDLFSNDDKVHLIGAKRKGICFNNIL